MLITLSQLFVAPALEIIIKIFPDNMRYRGVALGNCIGLAFFGGSTPYISGYLIAKTKLTWSPAIYLFIIAILGFASVLIVKKTKTDTTFTL
jgi:MFS transporter, MHS family, proline/betaine transporter